MELSLQDLWESVAASLELQDVHVICRYMQEVRGALPITLLVPPKILKSEIQGLQPFSETIFQDFSRLQIDFSRTPELTITLSVSKVTNEE